MRSFQYIASLRFYMSFKNLTTDCKYPRNCVMFRTVRYSFKDLGMMLVTLLSQQKRRNVLETAIPSGYHRRGQQALKTRNEVGGRVERKMIMKAVYWSKQSRLLRQPFCPRDNSTPPDRPIKRLIIWAATRLISTTSCSFTTLFSFPFKRCLLQSVRDVIFICSTTSLSLSQQADYGQIMHLQKMCISLYLIKHHSMNTYGGVEV
jgi:hypothetical protein